jgi:hypothetical protein
MAFLTPSSPRAFNTSILRSPNTLSRHILRQRNLLMKFQRLRKLPLLVQVVNLDDSCREDIGESSDTSRRACSQSTNNKVRLPPKCRKFRRKERCSVVLPFFLRVYTSLAGLYDMFDLYLVPRYKLWF